MDSIFQGSRSTDIGMTLVVNQRKHKVSHSDRDFFLLDEPAEVQPGPALFVLSIDGNSHEIDVKITQASTGRKVWAVRFSDAAMAQPA